MINIWTDGSGTLRDGPACIGVLLEVDSAPSIEVSEYVGLGTNNVAELRAIRRGLWLAEAIGGLGALVTVKTDSQYAINAIHAVALKQWEPRENAALIQAIADQVLTFHRFPIFEHVPGHSGVLGNEIADWLAGEARRRYFDAHPDGRVRKPKLRPDDPRRVRRARAVASDTDGR